MRGLLSLLNVYFHNMNYGGRTLGHDECCAASPCRDQLRPPSGSAACVPGGESQLQPGQCGSLRLSRGLREPWGQDHFRVHRERHLERKYFDMHRYRFYSPGLLFARSEWPAGARDLKLFDCCLTLCSACAWLCPVPGWAPGFKFVS